MYADHLEKINHQSSNTYKPSSFAKYAYDAVWVVAHSLNRTLEQLEWESSTGSAGSSECSSSGDVKQLSQMVGINLEHIQLQGLSVSLW